MKPKARGWCWLFVLCLLSLAGAVLAQPAARPLLLRFNFVPNHTDALAVNLTGEGQMDVTGMPNGQEVHSPLQFNLAMPLDIITESVDADGNGSLRMSLGTIDMHANAAGQDVRLLMDLAQGNITVNGQAFPMPVPAVGKLLGQMTLVISPQGKLVDVQGLEQLQGLMGMVGPAGFMSGMSKDQLLAMMRAQNAKLPDDPVCPGDSWEQTMTIPFPPEAPTQTHVTYTFKELRVVGGHPVAVIGISGALELKDLPLPAAPPPSPAPGAAGPAPGAQSGNMLDLLSMNMTGEMGLPLDGGYLHDAKLDLTLNVETSNQRPEGTIHTKLRDLKLTYDLTPRGQ